MTASRLHPRNTSPGGDREAGISEGRDALAVGDAGAARRAFLDAAESGCVEAAFPAAVMLLRGEGGDADPEEGLRWLRTAARHGARGAALLLGGLRLATVGAAADGVKWLRVAAAAGDAEAWHLLGLACLRGAGVKRDAAKARALQQKAAMEGVLDAQYELSLLLAQGIGGRVDTRGAIAWETKAADAGHPWALKNRDARLANTKPRKGKDWGFSTLLAARDGRPN